MGLDKLRRSKRTVIRALAPLLALVWLGTAAAPCATLAMDAPADHMSGHRHVAPPAEPVQHHGDQGDCVVCPHCAQRSSLPATDNLATHSQCITAPAWLARGERAVLSDSDLTPALANADSAPLSLPCTGPPGSPAADDGNLPHVALYVRFCTFLN